MDPLVVQPSSLELVVLHRNAGEDVVSFSSRFQFDGHISSHFYRNDQFFYYSTASLRAAKSLKVLDFWGQISRPWKVLENDFGP